MNTREKLIELLSEIACKTDDERCRKCVEQDCVRCAYENVADHLIANGVTIATDNNVGDKLSPTDKDINVPSKWIPVTERLPDCADTVLAVDGDGTRATAYYVGYWHSGGELDEYAVTHWMPLPLPPEGE